MAKPFRQGGRKVDRKWTEANRKEDSQKKREGGFIPTLSILRLQEVGERTQQTPRPCPLLKGDGASGREGHPEHQPSPGLLPHLEQCVGLMIPKAEGHLCQPLTLRVSSPLRVPCAYLQGLPLTHLPAAAPTLTPSPLLDLAMRPQMGRHGIRLQ